MALANKTKGINWQRCKSKRELGYASKKESVGPGQYNIDKINIFPIYKFQNSSVFSSKVPRMENQKQKMKYSHKKRASLSAPKQLSVLQQIEQDEDDDEGVPGPGYYYNMNTISDFNLEPNTGKNQYFGSTVERFPQPKVTAAMSSA